MAGVQFAIETDDVDAAHGSSVVSSAQRICVGHFSTDLSHERHCRIGIPIEWRICISIDNENKHDSTQTQTLTIELQFLFNPFDYIFMAARTIKMRSIRLLAVSELFAPFVLYAMLRRETRKQNELCAEPFLS